MVPRLIDVPLCAVAGPAPEGERPSIAAAALQSHVPDGPPTKTSSHPARSQAGGLNFSTYL